MSDGRPQLATREMPPCEDGATRFSVCIRGLNHHFGQGELRKQVLFDNNLELAPGEIVIMTGPSGSGKTTLLTLIGGLRTVQDGSLTVMGQELSGRNASELGSIRRHIGFIFQAHNLFASLTAMQNVGMALQLGGGSAAEREQKAKEMLEALGLGHRLKYKPGSLSGGQRQRVAIARALVNRPRIVLADEPTAALDKQSGRDVVDLLRKFAKEHRCTILMVTHDNRILDVADRIVNMVDGRVISDVVVSAVVAVTEFLRQCPLFKSLTPGTLSEVADKVTIEKHPAGAVVVRQGDPGDKFYLIRSGTAEVHVSDGVESRLVATLKDGDFFGEAALLTGEPRNATVKAADALEVYVLGKDDFKVVIESSASFKEELRKTIFERQ